MAKRSEKDNPRKRINIKIDALLTNKENALLNGSEAQAPLDDISRVLNILDELALASPEFSVILEVHS